jgi:phosphatidylglycerol---prolipoprotein diacylglyceryl transferase
VIILAVIKPDWQFPVILHVGNWRVPIHPLCDVLAYSIGFQLYLYLSRRASGRRLNTEQNAWIFLGCLFGALIGAKLLAWAEAPALYWALRGDPNFWFGGKTIVGGLLGGWAGIEIAKKALGVTGSTGDACVYPLILGMCIGRVGCFLTGLSDSTCGLPTTLPWGVDYGDGIPRHPAQIYEILFLLGLGVVLWIKRYSFQVNGLMFRWFLLSYLAFRFYIDFFKPHWTLWGGLSGIQWGCLIGILFCSYSLMKLSEQSTAENSHG